MYTRRIAVVFEQLIEVLEQRCSNTWLREVLELFKHLAEPLLEQVFKHRSNVRT